MMAGTAGRPKRKPKGVGGRESASVHSGDSANAPTRCVQLLPRELRCARPIVVAVLNVFLCPGTTRKKPYAIKA